MWPQGNRKLNFLMKVTLKKIVTYMILSLWALICVVPVLWLFVTSFKAGSAIDDGPYYLPFVDFWPSLESWSFIVFSRHESFIASYGNSVLVSVCATVLTLSVSYLAVYGLTRSSGFGGKWLYGAALATRILPPFVVALPIYMMAQVTGLLDSRLLLILVYAAINLPMAMWLLLPLIGKTASAQEEAARMDGASTLTIIFEIVFPMVTAGLAAVTLIVFLQCFNEYVLAAILTTDKAMTMPPFLVGQLSVKEAQVGGDAEEWPQFSAVLMLMLVPVLASTAYVQKYLGRLVVRR
jgi:multiple sugar transport system permease protein